MRTRIFWRGLAGVRRHQRHQKRYDVIGRGEKCAASTTVRGHTILTDTPRSGGGNDTAAQPVETLLAALIGCESATAHFVARQFRVKIDSIDFALDAVRDVRGSAHIPVEEPAPAPNRLQEITGVARVTTDDPNVDEELLVRLGNVVHERCPIANMVSASGCALHVEWRLANSE